MAINTNSEFWANNSIDAREQAEAAAKAAKKMKWVRLSSWSS